MKNFKKNFKNNMKNENGAVMVFVAIIMVILLAFASLGIEFGLAYYQKERIQTACDAAALAGAQYLPDTAQAKKYAKEYFKSNFNGEATVNVEFSNIGVSGKEKITVSATTGVRTTLGSVVGTKNLNLVGTATAISYSEEVPAAASVSADGEFPYLLYSQSNSGTLDLEGNFFEIDGSVHSNGPVKDYPAKGSVQQLSYGTNLTLQGEYLIRVGNVNFAVYKNQSWGLQKLEGTINLNSIKAEIDSYYLIPSEIYDASGNRQWWIQSVNWVNNTELYTSATKEVRAEAIAFSTYVDAVFKNETFTSPSDLPVKQIAEYKSKAEERIDNLANKVTNKFAEVVGSSVNKTNDNTYFASSHNETKGMVVSNSGQYYVSSLPSNVEQKASVIAYKGNGYQFINASPSSSTKYKCNDLVFYTDTSASNDNGIAVRNMKITTGSIYSNDKMKIRNEGGKAGDFIINGNVYAKGDLYLYHVTVNGDIFCTGSITAEGCCINGFVGAAGDISYKGEKPDICSYSATNPMALSVYSRNGDIEFVAGDSSTPQYVAGVILAPKGNVQINSNMKFYGNVIGNTIKNISASLYAYPLSALDGFTSDNILTVSGGGTGGAGETVTTEKKVFLVE